MALAAITKYPIQTSKRIRYRVGLMMPCKLARSPNQDRDAFRDLTIQTRFLRMSLAATAIPNVATRKTHRCSLPQSAIRREINKNDHFLAAISRSGVSLWQHLLKRKYGCGRVKSCPRTSHASFSTGMTRYCARLFWCLINSLFTISQSRFQRS